MWGGSLGMVDGNGADRRTEGHLTYMDPHHPYHHHHRYHHHHHHHCLVPGGSWLVSKRGTPVELRGARLTWLMSPRHSPPVRRSGSHGKASKNCLTLFYPAFKKSCYCIKDKLSSANGMQNVLKQCIVCMNVNVCMIYTVVLDTLLLDHLPGLKQPTQMRTNAVVAFILLKRLFVFFGKICHFCRWDICPSRIWPFQYFMLQKIFSLNRSLYVSPLLKNNL